jgi:hypothetical protein
MNLQQLNATGSWGWPEDARQTILKALTDNSTPTAERLIATELAGDMVVIDDDLVYALLGLLSRSDLPEELRGKAAISLGPVLEETYLLDPEDPLDESSMSAGTLKEILEVLPRLYRDAEVPKHVRRRILEAAVRYPQDWHPDAIRAAYASADSEWKLTAVFSMRFIRGFDAQILEALDSSDPDILMEAVAATGTWDVKDGHGPVIRIVESKSTPKPLLLAAIEAVGGFEGEDTELILSDLAESPDEEIREAVDEAIALSGGVVDFEDEEEEFEDPEDDGEDLN